MRIGIVIIISSITFEIVMLGMAAGMQLAGLHGDIVASKFILGPSWGWVTFDVVGIILGVGFIAWISYGLPK